jgi:SNF2 family DNA or RNA helicase
MLSRSDLHAYQNRAVEFIKEKKRCALFLDMGMGKSVSTLTAITDLIDGFSARKVLVIAPLRVCNSVWAQERDKWSHLKDLRISVCTGSERKRISGLSIEADIYVINRENIAWLVKFLGKKWDFDTVVIDESSSFKSSSSQRFKALKKVIAETDHMILLTGTPSPNGLLDLWAQLYLVDFGQRLGRTMTSYKQRFFEPDYMGYKFSPRDGSDKKIHALISDCVMHMSAEDYLSLPERIDIDEVVQMPAQVRKSYIELEKELLAQLPDGEEIEAINAAALANKLMQYSNGAVYTGQDKNWKPLHSAKLDALAEIIEENPQENILVAYNYKFDLERLLERFPEAEVLKNDQDVIDRWNKGQIKMLLAHPASAGHGLNIQSGGSMIVWFGLNWSLELYQQFNARLHRQGQSKPVRIVHILSEDTIDQRVAGVLKQKSATQKDLLNALKVQDFP